MSSYIISNKKNNKKKEISMDSIHEIADYCSPFQSENIALNGPIGKLTDDLIYHRVNSPEARDIVYRETIEAFRNKLDDTKKVIGIWQGEYWGKWVISAVRAARYQKNAELKSFVRSAAYELISLRDPDGCISTYRNPAMFNAAPEVEVEKAIGTPSDWCWNIWCRKYTLWGLLEAWELTQDRHILEAAEKLTDQLLDTLEKDGTDIHDTGTFKGLASCSILKPVIILYRATGKERFRKFADFIVAGWEREDGKAPNLIANALSGKPVHEWYPDIKPWAKTYEMLSCFDGLLDYYRLTGHENSLKAAESLYWILLEHEANRPGCVGYNDQFVHAGIFLDSITEPCDAVHWMRLCFELFKLTGKVCCMDTFEHTFLNAFLAGIFRDGTWGMRAVRSSGHHMIAPEQAMMHYNHCCVNNLPRGLINAAESCLMHTGRELLLNQYIPFSAESDFADGHFRISVSGEYLTEGCVQVRADNEKPLKLKLRIPAWSGSARVAVNGREHTAVPGYDEVELSAGSNRIDLKFDLHPQVIRFPYPGDPDNFPAWQRRRYYEGKDTEGLVLHRGYYATVAAGPLLLSRSKLIGSTEEEMFAPSVLGNGSWKCRLVPEKMPGVFAGFKAEFTSDAGETFSCGVCDFASAGNIDSADPKLFSMFF